MAKKRQKQATGINIRTLIGLASALLFALIGGILAFTVWFMFTVLNDINTPPETGQSAGRAKAEAINAKLLETIEGKLSGKNNQPIGTAAERRDPFMMTDQLIPPPAESPTAEPAATGENGADPPAGATLTENP